MAVDNDIYNIALNDGMPDQLAKLIVAQSKHETDNYTSDFFVRYNNAFGYSCVQGAKWQAGCGAVADNGSPIAAYAGVADSVHELTDWVKRRVGDGSFPTDLSTITDAGQYATLLKDAGYYGDTVADYAAGIKRWFTDNLTVVGGISAAAVIGIVIALWLIFKK